MLVQAAAVGERAACPGAVLSAEERGWPGWDGRLPLGPVLARFHWLSLFHSEKGIGPRYHGLLVECTTFQDRGSFVVAAETSSSSVDKGDILVVLPIFPVSSHLKLFKLFNPIWLLRWASYSHLC